MGQSTPEARTMEAERLALKGPEGKMWASVEASPNSPFLIVYRGNGTSASAVLQALATGSA
jgi:hypothetical protein